MNVSCLVLQLSLRSLQSWEWICNWSSAAMLQLHLCDQQFYCLQFYCLHQRFEGTFKNDIVSWKIVDNILGFLLQQLAVSISTPLRLAMYCSTFGHSIYAPTGLCHIDGCRCPSAELAPDHQQTPCWRKYNHGVTWINICNINIT